VEKIGRLVFAVVLAAAVGFSVGWLLGKSDGKKEMMVEAVGNNYGHYRLLNDLGHTQFEWGPPPAAYPAPPKK
jgi:hypothetical protein